MFETIQNTTQKIQGTDAGTIPSNVPPLKPAASSTPSGSVNGKPQQHHAGKVSSGDADKHVTQDLLNGMAKDLEAMHNVELQFSVQEKTGKVVVEVVDKSTHKTIRQIPSKTVLALASRMDEMAGILFDKKA